MLELLELLKIGQRLIFNGWRLQLGILLCQILGLLQFIQFSLFVFFKSLLLKLKGFKLRVCLLYQFIVLFGLVQSLIGIFLFLIFLGFFDFSNLCASLSRDKGFKVWNFLHIDRHTMVLKGIESETQVYLPRLHLRHQMTEWIPFPLSYDKGAIHRRLLIRIPWSGVDKIPQQLGLFLSIQELKL